MSSIYGWLSTATTSALGYTLDSQFAASTCLTAATERVAINHERAGLGGHGNVQVPSVYQTAGLSVILEGTPHWDDPVLAELAHKLGAAAALADGYLRYGRSVLEKIKGPFAFALLQPERNYALLAIDRIGIYPLAFYYADGLLVLASQLGQLVAHSGVKTETDPQGIFNYLYFHMIPSPGSIYKGVSKLQPGEFAELESGSLKRDFYWHRHYQDSLLSKAELLRQLPLQLEQAVAACVPDEHTGAFLSGGLDSSTVTGFFQKLAGRPIDAFTMGFDAEGYDEMEYARAAAQHFKVKLHEYYVTPADVLQAIPLIAQTYSEPFGNASAIPTYYCAKFARERGMTQLLAGDGGDEIFAGNARYAKQLVFDVYRHVPGFAKAVLEPLAGGLPPLQKLKSYIDQANIPMPARMETYNFLHRTPLAEIFSEEFLGQIDAEVPLHTLQSTYRRTPGNDLVKQMLYLDGKFTLADNDLRKVSQMCELAGIRVQYPMLQENLVEFAATIPSKWLMQRFELRAFYRESLQDFLPKTTLAKNKQGFGLPFGVWMAEDKELKQFAEASLASIEKRNFLNPAYIKKLIQLHQEGHASYYGVMIWLLIMLEQWLVSHSV